MATMILEAGVGAAVGELLRAVLDMTEKAVRFKPTLERLGNSLKRIKRVIDEIEQYKRQLDRSKEETEELVKLMEEGKKLVLKCSKIDGWIFFPLWPHYQEKLEELDNSILRFFRVDLPAQTARDVMEVLLEVRGSRRKEIGGLCSAPEAPLFAVGLEVPLRHLKPKLLQVGFSVTVVTGSGGSGKTTLAKLLCQDEQVKGKFKDNIFFVTSSKTPNLKTIVEKLYQHTKYEVPQLQSEEDTVNQLENLLKTIGKSPILLVLDDVWSDSLVDSFVFRQMPDYKILVTSRSKILRFGDPYILRPLDDQDAIKLLHHSASPNNSTFDVPEDLVTKIISGCRGSPLALKVIGRSLCGQDPMVWQCRAMALSKGHQILDSSTEVLACLQKSFDALDTMAKECFMDLGLFPEDQRIAAAALVDVWTELHDEDDFSAMVKIYELANQNMADIFVRRKVASGLDNYNQHFVTQHDLLRDLAIYQSSQEPEIHRNRLIFDINENNLPNWWGLKEAYPVAARILSISTDEEFGLAWCNMQPINVEVLVLNLHAKEYTLPPFVEKMSKLKVLLVTNYGLHRADLDNLEVLGSLSNLKRVRLEQVSIPSLDKTKWRLKNLKKLSLFMCNMNEAFKNCAEEISDMLPKLVEINIDYCNLVELPSELCNIVCLKKLSITNCHILSALPEGIGKLVNLELLRLSACATLKGLPDSIRNLKKLKYLDISDCVSLTELPEHIGELRNLEKLYMKGCSRISELPLSVEELKRLEKVLCDEETVGLWENFETELTDLSKEVAKIDVSLDWLYNSGN